MSYRGLTLVLNRPSRFDYNGLISGKCGEWFDLQLGKLGWNRTHIELMTASMFAARGFNPTDGTRTILALGDEAQRIFNTGTSLNEQRGSPYMFGEIPLISTFAPQDAFDFKDFESILNPGEDENEDDSHDPSYGKSHGSTSRKNYRFWLSRDLRKAIRISQEGLTQYNPQYEFYVNPKEICDILKKHKGCTFYFDIETIPETLDVTVFAFMFELPDGTITPTYVVPIWRFDMSLAYGNDTALILQAFAVALRDNVVVTHNGAQYDLFVIAFKYKIPFGRRNYDTMIAQNRLFPEVEKSLGHAISLFTDLPYHKNDGIFKPHNLKQERQLWEYNGKDVFSMYMVKKAQDRYARAIGAIESVQQANDSIRVYLTETFTGIRRNIDEVNTRIAENLRRIIALNRILEYLVGRPLNVGSPKQMKEYLFNKKEEGGMGLEPTDYSDKPSKKTGKVMPKADKKSLLKLHIKYNLPTVPLVIELRQLKKQNSSLAKVIHFLPNYELQRKRPTADILDLPDVDNADNDDDTIESNDNEHAFLGA